MYNKFRNIIIISINIQLQICPSYPLNNRMQSTW